MRLLRTSISRPRFVPRLPGLRFRQSIFGVNIGSSVSTRDAARAAGGALDLDAADLLKRALDGDAPVEEEAPEVAPPPRSAPAPIRRRGPATLLERRDRLDYALERLAVRGAAVEFQANTIAVIKPMHPIVRFIKFVLTLPIIPIRWVLRAIAWAFTPRGQGKMNRTVVFIDRRGNVVVYKM